MANHWGLLTIAYRLGATGQGQLTMGNDWGLLAMG